MLGSDLVQICRQQGFEPIVLDLPDFDISNSNQLRQAITGAEIIVNCAAYTNVDGAESQAKQANEINAEAVGRLGAFAQKAGKWVLHISTDFVFDGGGDKPYVETDNPNPINTYGKTKLAGERLLAQIEGPVLTFGEKAGSDIRIVSWTPLEDGALIRLEIYGTAVEAQIPLMGRFNAQNAAAAAGVACALGISTSRIGEALPALEPVPGRMEPVRMGQPFSVLVDYAHTPDALEKALTAVREHTRGRLVSLFGCGGDRYRLKRGAMGEISSRLADFTVVTSDNPRSEEPAAIISEIVQGARRTGSTEGKDFIVVQDRKKAIFKAMGLMKSGDALLIAGKGHEDYQILPDGRIHFDDREVAREALASLGYIDSSSM